MEQKDGNPKDALGVSKIPWDTLPYPPMAEVALAMLTGAVKYGRHNYRDSGVRAKVYFSACMRHLVSWWEGEDKDLESGLSHLAHAICCLMICRDAQINGKLHDDRPPPANPDWLRAMNAWVKEFLTTVENPKPDHIHDHNPLAPDEPDAR